MRIYLGSDHAGYRAKEGLQAYLKKRKIGTIDFGTHSEEPVDYPDIALKVAERVAKDKNSLGLLVCGTGIGMSIAANKVRGIRAANPFNEFTASAAREHNNANIICLGGRTYGIAAAKKILAAFLAARPSREKRHLKRIDKISKLEK